MKVLVLNSWFIPHRIIRWEDAITMIFKGTVDTIVEYQEEIKSPSITIKAPAVIRLRRQIKKYHHQIKFSRRNVYTRDRFTCQYCNQRFSEKNLSYDHVIPRKRGGRTEWTNIVTACKACNRIKADQTCDEAGMFPINEPVCPKFLPINTYRFGLESIPEEWNGFCGNL